MSRTLSMCKRFCKLAFFKDMFLFFLLCTLFRRARFCFNSVRTLWTQTIWMPWTCVSQECEKCDMYKYVLYMLRNCPSCVSMCAPCAFWGFHTWFLSKTCMSCTLMSVNVCPWVKMWVSPMIHLVLSCGWMGNIVNANVCKCGVIHGTFDSHVCTICTSCTWNVWFGCELFPKSMHNVAALFFSC